MSFDRIAPHYRWLEGLLAGEILQRCRIAQLRSLDAVSDVLICGEGNGRFLVAFCRRFPQARITCLDGSARMLELADQRARRTGIDLSRVTLVHADILDWLPPTAAFDLIVTHFFLDCFRRDQLARIIPTLGTAAKPKATWLLADFKVSAGRVAEWRSRAILASMYLFFRAVTRLPARTLTPPDPFLERAGFSLQNRVEMEWGLLHSDRWQRTR